jgi:hypothetical protein
MTKTEKLHKNISIGQTWSNGVTPSKISAFFLVGIVQIGAQGQLNA